MQAFYCHRDRVCETLPSASYNMGRSYQQASDVSDYDCHIYICPVIWEAFSQMYQVLTAGNVFPERLHCVRDPIKKHTSSCCCVAHNYLPILGQVNASADHGSGCSSISCKSFARSGEHCCTDYIWIIWILEGAMWGEARRPSLTQNILTR